MITPQKVEWITFLTTNITTFGENVYPEFTDRDRNAEPFCVVEVIVLSSEPMITGTMYFGFARLTFVASDPKMLDHTLIDKFGDELELKYQNFVQLTVTGINNVSKVEKYTPEKENLLKREVDVGMSWYKAH